MVNVTHRLSTLVNCLLPLSEMVSRRKVVLIHRFIPYQTRVQKGIKGHKRHVVVDTMGIPLQVKVTDANASDSQKCLRSTGGGLVSV